MKNWIESFLSILFPRYCIVCSTILGKGEECLCISCNIGLPRTNYHLEKDNFMEKLLWGRVPLEHATSYLFYYRGSDYRKIIHRLKYNGQEEVGRLMGAQLTTEIIGSGFFDSIDIIIPVPLHRKRLHQRGYNQSEIIARGISEITGIAVDNSLVTRKRNTGTQTQQTVFNRSENMEDAFIFSGKEEIINKHILLVDDVLTTGATIAACSKALEKAGCKRISVITLAIAVS